MSFPRYPAYKDSGVEWLGEVPEHWEVVTIKRIASLQSGTGITADSITDEGPYPVYGGNGVRGYTDANTHEGYFPIIGRQGALCGNVNYAKGGFWASEHAVVVTPCWQAEVHWLGETLRSMNLNQYSVSAAQPGLSVEAIVNLFIPRPPRDEQIAISAFLNRETTKIDALIAEQQRLIELLQEKRQAVISHAVTKGLNPDAPMKDSGVEWLGEVPEHWTVKRIKHTSRMESGHTPDRKVEAYWVNCDIPWVSLNDTGFLKDNDYISETAYCINDLGIQNSSARLLPERVVVFSRDATIGRCAITTRQMAVSQHFIAWVCGDEIIPEYLLLRLKSMTQELERLTFGATLKTIGMPDVKTLVTPVPPKKEQEEIVEYLKGETARLEGISASAQQAVALLQERRSALISVAVTGQIDLRGVVSEAEVS